MLDLATSFYFEGEREREGEIDRQSFNPRVYMVTFFIYIYLLQ